MREMCPTTGKVSYESRTEASKARAALRTKKHQHTDLRGEMDVFRCDSCGSWHVGHRVGRRAA